MTDCIRAIEKADYPLLEEFLYQAIFVPEGVVPPSRGIIYESDIFVYIRDFGGEDDTGVVAEMEGKVVGAAWARIIPAYGHVDNETPELALSVLPAYRGRGIGTKLLAELFQELRKKGYKKTSLSVQKDNPAVRLYLRAGYKIIAERPDGAGHEDYLMVKDLLK